MCEPGSGERGFTLVELLVVVVVIGTLIAIAIPVYLRFQQGSYDASAKADLRTLRLEEQSYRTSQPGYATTRQLVTANPQLKLSKSSVGAVMWSSADGYCVAATNTRGPEDRSAPFASYGYGYKSYFYDSTTGRTSATQCPTPPGATAFDGTYVDETGFHG